MAVSWDPLMMPLSANAGRDYRELKQERQTDLGYTAEQVIDKSNTTLFQSDRINYGVTLIDKVEHGERVDHCETFYRRKDAEHPGFFGNFSDR